MKTMKIALNTVILAALVGLGGCAGMSTQDRNTAIGAGAGAVVGNVIGGGLLGTAAGAVAGGVIGHEVSKPR
jgi:osmotically inducible lipoprotein OsmB